MKRLTTTVVCITSALVATITWAQERDTQQQQPGQARPGLQQPGSRDATYGATGRAGMHGTQLRASKAIGAEVKSSTGEKLGKIEDFVLNPATGRIEFAVLDCENKLVAVPTKLLTPTEQRTAITGAEKIGFTAQVEKDKLDSAPTISDKNRWSELQQPGWSQRVYSHYGVQIEGVGAPGLGIEREQGTSPRGQPGREPKDQQKSPGTSPN